MKYREQLKKIKELGLNMCDLTVAHECDCVFDFEYTEEEFEQLCEFAVYIYLKWEDGTAKAIADAINDLIKNGGCKIDELLEMNKHEFIEFACYSV